MRTDNGKTVVRILRKLQTNGKLWRENAVNIFVRGPTF